MKLKKQKTQFFLLWKKSDFQLIIPKNDLEKPRESLPWKYAFLTGCGLNRETTVVTDVILSVSITYKKSPTVK